MKLASDQSEESMILKGTKDASSSPSAYKNIYSSLTTKIAKSDTITFSANVHLIVQR